MKKIANYFKRLSLTQQIILIILSFVIFFFAFFFLFLSGNIDRTISVQMYDLMESRQESIVTILKSDSSPQDKTDYFKIAVDKYQINCLIDGDSIQMLGKPHQKSFDADLKRAMIEKAALVRKNGKVEQGTIRKRTNSYYYRLCQVRTKNGNYVLASFMDDSYSEILRSSLVDSTFDLTIFAYFIMLLIMMIWVYSIIHPLNQIKLYIEQVKMGKEVELHVNRKDEIGEVADALVTMKEDLTKQEKAKEEMIHNISHDLKTPIATIKSYAESIKDGIYPYGTMEKSVDVIIENAQRLEDKVHNLLYLNRVEYLVTSDAEGVLTNMKDVVEEVLLNSAVIRKDIEIQTDIEEVFFDGLLESWRVTIENIMENAFRYAKSYIKIEVHENDLKISNDGPKMDEDRIETLFHPYEKGEGGRFGLGLSIVDKVVKANHYRVRGFNTEDGVCFEIYRDVPNKKDHRRRNQRQKNKKENYLM